MTYVYKEPSRPYLGVQPSWLHERFSANRSSSDSTQRNAVHSEQLPAQASFAPFGAHCRQGCLRSQALQAGMPALPGRFALLTTFIPLLSPRSCLVQGGG
jgi:hypothetical protein